MSKYSQFHSEWLDKYRSGMNCPEIAAEYGCNASIVNIVVRNAGISRSNREAQLLLSDYSKYHNEWIKMYKEGMSTLDIASIYGCCGGTVGDVVRHEGITRSNRDPQYLRDTKYGRFHNEWIDQYNSGISATKIASTYGCSKPTVITVIRNAGVIRSLSQARLLLDSKYKRFYNEWIQKYLSGMSTTEIAADYGTNSSTVCAVIRRARKSRSTLDIHNMRYKEYDTYFDDINDEGSAYFLGLLLANGCIRIRKVSMQQVMILSLQADDGYMVEKLAGILGRKLYVHPPRGRSKASVSVHAHSDHIVNTLRGYGFTERKSLDNHDAVGFDHVPSNLMHHFIRGIIDGDGSISISGNGHPFINIVGNYNDMQAITNIFHSIGCRMKMPRKAGKIYQIVWGARDDVTKIIHYLYEDATIYLERKKQRADKILELYSNRDNNTRH